MLVITMLSPESMGVSVVALSLSRILNALHQSIAMVLFPKTVGGAPEDVVLLTGRAQRSSLILSTFGAASSSSADPHSSSFSTDRSTQTSAPVSRSSPSHKPSWPSTDPGIVTLLQLAGLLTALPLLLLLVLRYGVLGAAGAVFLSTLTRFLFTILSFKALLGLPPPAIIPNVAALNWLLQRISSLRPRSVPAGNLP